MRPFKTIGFRLVLLSIPTAPVLAQPSADTASFSRSPALLQRYVRNELGPDSRLYNGYEYIRNGTPAKGFPFFGSDSLQSANLSYDGILYEDIPMEYDLVLDRAVIRDFTGKALIGLISEKVDYFSIGEHRFRYVAADKTAGNHPDPGFYEVLFASGATTLYAKRVKKLFFPTNREEMARYDQDNAYYLQLNNRYYKVDGKDALLNSLKDKKDALKKYIHAAKLSFSKQTESALIQTTAYYTQLSH